MQREFAIRRLAKHEGYRLEKKGDDSYRHINARFNVAVYQLDGVSLERIAAFLEKRTIQANSPDAQHR
jgi:predicted transcriptional regulator